MQEEKAAQVKRQKVTNARLAKLLEVRVALAAIDETHTHQLCQRGAKA